YMQKRLRELADHPLVGEVRGVGLIAALELVGDKATKAPHEKVGTLGGLANAAMFGNGVITRNMADAIAFCPPMIITPSQVDDVVAATKKSLDETLAAIGRA
ncbi:aminotransferase class III-fold pyridoxal phosphate-dependent enzyme, partial [Agrobacterium sp. S2]|nr:aminotransferase class III-fold pyridoxal phosphate-dependent enzyme [Agrobacterium sp. S2]